jgi:hypothetical protein
MPQVRFRQVHLDFHTSPFIPGVGSSFDKENWQKVLRTGHVNSINLFSKCHHGWSYHPTKVGRCHPSLEINLLKAQIDACKELDIIVPIYLSAGLDNLASEEHPEWRQIGADGRYNGWTSDILASGFHKMCFNSPYLDYLCGQITEVVNSFPEGDGIWLDIIFQGQCCCKWCLSEMKQKGLDPTKEADRIKCSQMALERYYRETTAAARSRNPNLPIFHNAGQVECNDRDILKYFSHLEVESLPTGGWGYDHFPATAKYYKKLGVDFVGMTGKFQTMWGEFGGYKHPNALRYECAAMLAYGAKCSIGDQLHPDGKMDKSTYEIIGDAYSEVEKKEPWCRNVENIADIGLLWGTWPDALKHEMEAANTGACRLLLEGHFLFDVLDTKMDFSPYKVMILPDGISIDDSLKIKLDKFLVGGGKLFLTGKSGLDTEGKFCFDVGADHFGANDCEPDYVLPVESLRPSFVDSPLVMYRRAQKIKVTSGKSLGMVYDSYFNRTWNHFCSHQHTPPQTQPNGFDSGVLKGNILYLAHPVFTIYYGLGAVTYKDYISSSLKLLLGKDQSLSCTMPSTARVSLMTQEKERRYILHLLYANTITRGGGIELSGGALGGKTREINIIEELLPLRNIEVSLNLPKKVAQVTLEPQGEPISFTITEGRINLKIDSFTCHQMVVLNYNK